MLETEIIKLREAVEALTAAIANSATPTAQEQSAAEPETPEPETPEPETPEPETPEPEKVDGINFQMVKDRVLELSRASDANKSAIRDMLTELGVKRLQQLDATGLESLYHNLQTLGGAE